MLYSSLMAKLGFELKQLPSPTFQPLGLACRCRETEAGVILLDLTSKQTSSAHQEGPGLVWLGLWSYSRTACFVRNKAERSRQS